MKTIICYGDSNTFGHNPINGSRFDENTRWTGLLQKNLGAKYNVINEGMCSRTGFTDNRKGFQYSAQRHFPKIISKFDNIDFLILAIGTNDLMFQYDISFGTIEKGLENLINQAKPKANKIIIIPPAILNEKILEGYFSSLFDKTSVIKSRKIVRIYRTLAGIYDCIFWDINKFTKPSDIDGLHYDKNSHKIIADELTSIIQQNL